jgi:uncharacterized damage-inducible protein DinB
MFTGTYALLMAEYNRWMNEKVYAACATLADAERKRDRGAFFKSIHATLNHLLWGDGAWLTRFNGKSYPARPRPGQLLHDDFDQLRAARGAMDEDILDWARAVTPQARPGPRHADRRRDRHRIDRPSRLADLERAARQRANGLTISTEPKRWRGFRSSE